MRNGKVTREELEKYDKGSLIDLMFAMQQQIAALSDSVSSLQQQKQNSVDDALERIKINLELYKDSLEKIDLEYKNNLKNIISIDSLIITDEDLVLCNPKPKEPHLSVCTKSISLNKKILNKIGIDPKLLYLSKKGLIDLDFEYGVTSYSPGKIRTEGHSVVRTHPCMIIEITISYLNQHKVKNIMYNVTFDKIGALKNSIAGIDSHGKFSRAHKLQCVDIYIEDYIKLAELDRFKASSISYSSQVNLCIKAGKNKAIVSNIGELLDGLQDLKSSIIADLAILSGSGIAKKISEVMSKDNFKRMLINTPCEISSLVAMTNECILNLNTFSPPRMKI